MKKRDLFNELMEGFDALKASREGKITLKTAEVEVPKPIKMTANQIAKIRKTHNYSQAVFARIMATNVATFRNWEQGRSQPNAQAKVLLKMVEADPGVLATLSAITDGAIKVKVSAKTKPKVKPRVKSKRKAAAKKVA